MNMIKVSKMKTILVLLTAILIAISFFGCNTIDDNIPAESSNETNDESSNETNDESSNETNDESDNKENQIGNYIVTISSAKVVSNGDENILVVTYEFTNNSNNAKAFIFAVADKLFQAGVELESSSFSFGFADEYDSSSQTVEVQPGSTLSVQCAYKLNDTTTVVDVEISKWISLTDDKITFKIYLEHTDNISDNAIVATQVSNIVTDGKIGNYIVSVLSAKTVHNNDKTILIVTYSFTNNGNEDKSFIYAASDKLFQNGIELNSVYSSYGFADEYDSTNQTKEVQPGGTLSVQCAYELNDPSTVVDVELSEWLGNSGKKAVYKIFLEETDSIPEDAIVATQVSNIVTDGKIGNYIVSVLSAKTVHNNDKTILIVTYSFTNNGNEDESFIYAVSDKLFQNGIELNSVYSSYGFADEYDSSSQTVEVQPGGTLSVQCAYELNDPSTVVDVELSEWLGNSEKKAVYSITLE